MTNIVNSYFVDSDYNTRYNQQMNTVPAKRLNTDPQVGTVSKPLVGTKCIISHEHMTLLINPVGYVV